jgi:hypothetical protein
MSDSSQSRLEQKVDLNLLKPQHALKKSQLSNDLLVLLRSKVAEHPASYALKNCQEWLLYVCKLVEELIKKSDGINKKELVKDLFRQLFSLQPAELQALDSAIEFLHSNNLIFKISISKKSWNLLKKKVACFL